MTSSSSFFHFMCDELHEALIPEVYLFLDHIAYMLFFQRQLPSALQLHQKTMWQAESVEVSEIQKKSVENVNKLERYFTKSLPSGIYTVK